ncbi:MAG TPA: GAF domain-containing protein [Telluria sp.]|nr:GAF domain-containing protein [Telluria sp.]
MTITLDTIRGCFEGVIPSTMATADADGTPNVSYLSQVQLVDSGHVALSYQFFNKTRRNLQENPLAMLALIDPGNGAHYRLALRFLRTETAGPLFESMKARLAGIASHVGMANVFKLLGADVFEVLRIEQVPGDVLAPAAPGRNLLAALRAVCERCRHQDDLELLLAAMLDALRGEFSICYAMVLLYDATGERLYTVASIGYERSGIGSEIRLGDGVIGVAARERTPIRISHMSAEYSYNRAIRANSPGAAEEIEIPFPGLADANSQLAVPLLAGPRLVGVLYVESPQPMRFRGDDEDLLVALGSQLALSIDVLRACDDEPAAPTPALPAQATGGEPVVVRHYPENDSIFLGGDYLIKGVAGSIFLALVRDFTDRGRTDFTNRELRLDPRIRLPDIGDNLEGRLLLLSRRLDERQAGVHIEKTGRGRFHLRLDRPIVLAHG